MLCLSQPSVSAVVEECLRNGLKKRALGLFKNSTTMALMQKVSKTFEPAAHIVKLVSDIENNQENKYVSSISVFLCFALTVLFRLLSNYIIKPNLTKVLHMTTPVTQHCYD